ncbi:NADH-quinone oxidoreductase subunit C [Actinomyces gaoshouyii]|uniref:NADH-quinone oxidoreductase subunit C n=1 Tax=Actinomyces gaoshouyii TaxID=1960083 RepID=UPI0009BD35FE|nr:NADH-quinone oxidoreductase subunit C [Actinomyces gaoshouyii]ARD42294.1 NADH-quinone oxidoreductase subunit C [Actinomyces gaoshouyii]
MSDTTAPKDGAPAEELQAPAPAGPAVPEIAGTPVRPELRVEVISHHSGQFGAADAGDTTGYGLTRSAVTLAPAATRPYGGWFDDAVDALVEDLCASGVDPAAAIEKVVVEHGELTLFIAREHLLDVVAPLRDDQDLRFELCLGVSGVHYPQLAGRELHACFQFMSLTHGARMIRLEVACPESDPHVPSIVSLYPGDDWHEREAWDLMGIVFDGHPHLTRSAMPDDWVGHPQRKDYPLGGIPVEYKGATTPPADTRRSYR